MDKCRLCGEINIHFINSDENSLSSKTNDNKAIQILAKRLLIFEAQINTDALPMTFHFFVNKNHMGYELKSSQNKNESIWICDYCRQNLQSFARLLKVIKQGQEKWQSSAQEHQQVDDKREELNEIQNIEENDNNTLNIKATITKNDTCCNDASIATDPLNDLPKKRLIRLPKRYQDNGILVTKKPLEIISNTMQSTKTTSIDLLPKIAGLRLANGRTIGHLVEVNYYKKSSKFRIRCTICPLVFRYEKEYRKHLENHKEQLRSESSAQLNSNKVLDKEDAFESFLYYCEICQKSFTEHYAVRRHYKQAHSQERKFSCNRCMAKFKYKFNLDYHISQHMDRKNFECSYCKKKFVLRYELMLHQRTHTKEKNYKCQICSNSFTHRSNLVAHLKLHTPRKTLNCSKCQASFRNVNYLKRHERNHTKNTENLLQTTENALNSKTNKTKNSYNLLDFEKFCNTNSSINAKEMNFSLPTFDSLQTNLKTSQLNSNQSINATKTIRIIKTPETNDYFDEMILSNGELIKSEQEPGSFKIGNTTIKILGKRALDNVQNIASTNSTNSKYFSDLCDNSTNSTDFIKSIDWKNSTNSPKNSILSIETNINSNNSIQISNNTIDLINYPINSPLGKTIQNQQVFSHFSNMDNTNNSTKSTQLQNEENFQFSTKEIQCNSFSENFINLNYFTNSPKNSSLLKFTENPYSINLNNPEDNNIPLKQSKASFFCTNTQSPTINLPEINTLKDFKLVKLSKEYISSKSISNYNTNNSSPLRLKNSQFIKILNLKDNNGNLTETNLNNTKEIPKLNYFLNNTTKSNDTLNTENILNLNNSTYDPLTIISYEDGIIQSESCLISPPLQVTKEDILSTNMETENRNDILNIITDQSPPSASRLPALKILKSVDPLKTNETSKAQNYIKTDENNSTEFLNNQVFIQNMPCVWQNSVTGPNCGEFLKIETYTNSQPLIENTSDSLLMKCPVTQVPVGTATTKITESLLNANMANSSTNSAPFKISKVFTNVELNSKPVKIYNLNNVKDMFKNSKRKQIPIKIISKSKEIRGINNSNDTTTALKNTTQFSKHLTIRKTPLKLKVGSKHSLLKPVTNLTQISDSLMIPRDSIEKSSQPVSPLKVLNSTNCPSNTQFEDNSAPSKPMITNVEILPPITLPPLTLPPYLNTSLNTSSCSATQNLVKIPVEYKFQCNKCSKYFKQRSALNKHLRTHTGDKPYKCHLCPKSYADASNYKKHKILHKNAANALNLSPHLPVYAGHNSPTHSIASDPDPDGIEIMQTIKKFECSSSNEDYDDDVESLTSSTMESYMWEDALDHAIINNEIHENIKRNLNNVIIPLNMDGTKHNHLTKFVDFTSEDPD